MKLINKLLINKKQYIPIIIPIVFFIIAIRTISDYGMNWDSPVHFARGQAFLRYFTSGKTDYNDLPKKCIGRDGFTSRVDYKTKEVCDKYRKVRVSEYQHEYLDYNFFKKDIYGHPPLSDIFTAVTNQIFFIKLGWFEDIDAYHVYNILATLILAITVAIWVNRTYGIFASIIATLSLYLFPLLLGEQHFNVKDPPMAAFFTLSIFLFWLAVVKKKPKIMLLSAITAGVSFATKFNYLFAPFILFPWVVIYVWKSFYSERLRFRIDRVLKVLPINIIGAIFLYPFIIFAVFYFSWPVLWPDPVNNVKLVFKFYQDIGGTGCGFERFSPGWFLNCTSFYAINYLLYTTPLITLFFLVIGVIVSITHFKKNNYVTVLWLFFFFLTILRVTLSVSSIYGGVRQIIEFIGPMAMISAVGAYAIRNAIVGRIIKISSFKRIGRKKIALLVSGIILLGYVPISIKMVSLHPNQNIYFNPLIGGLKGAAEKKFPDYGSTYGNVYLQGVKWLNHNAEENAKISLVSGVGQNLSRYQMRGDFSYLSNGLRSGYNQAGEYHILMISVGDPTRNFFRYQFVEKFLEPVYEVKVEGVPILKIWKNAPEYIKKGIDIRSEQREEILLASNEKEIIIHLKAVKKLKRLEINFNGAECKKMFIDSSIYTSQDESNFVPMQERLNDPANEEIKRYKTEQAFLFTGEKAKSIRLSPLRVSETCNFSDMNISVYSFEKL
ncbi:MAG: hypothetical protein A3D74_00720 [Candidatus Levybacteria bacterium RIFCSPHIGHO2_02_FULL_37_13]|nr:MAG: hypothetical protein A3D74_00720 [Candidatus Levybacteria bacterium RIFCSPHIGHO2_02_FULL_37_13]OGH37943.1 MAG: hypothetical protein A3B41_05015 [Candidatus Levybacteria bacterium RIFCSPLOWO2_01_FULL_37_26]